MPTVFPRSDEIASWYAESSASVVTRAATDAENRRPLQDAAEPAVLIVRTAVLDVLQPLTNREGGLATRTRADLIAAGLVFQRPDGSCDCGRAAGKKLSHLPRSDTVQQFVNTDSALDRSQPEFSG